MLHFVIGLAVCVWIVERLIAWRNARRWRKQQVYMAYMLRPLEFTSKPPRPKWILDQSCQPPCWIRMPKVVPEPAPTPPPAPAVQEPVLQSWEDFVRGGPNQWASVAWFFAVAASGVSLCALLAAMVHPH